MNKQYAVYFLTLFSCISSSIQALDGEMRVYDIKTHALIGSYQRIGTINGCKSGIVKTNNQNSIHVIEKPLQENSPTIIGYIKYKTTIRETGNSSKKSYLYQAEQSQETDSLKKKHIHLIP